MRADYINPAVYGRVFHLLTYENALALRLSLETGLRISDVLKTEVGDLSGCSLSYKAQKTGKEGKKTISADLAHRLRKISGDKWIFEGRFGDKPRTRQAVWKDLKNAAAELGITDNLTCHSARKTYAVNVFHDKGFAAAQRELQHSRIDNTMLYVFSDVLKGGTPAQNGGIPIEKFNRLYDMVEHLYNVLIGEAS